MDKYEDREAGVAPGYDVVRFVDHLPRKYRSDSMYRTHGYAVHLEGPVMGRVGWLFFAHLEPALVFGRAGRMGPASGYSVMPAAIIVRYDEALRRDHRELLLIPQSFDRQDDEVEIFRRWVDRIESQVPKSSHWQ